MANATVEKIKDLGLRHGEKVVVGLAAALCLVFVWQAFSRPTINLTPEQIEQVAKRAASNINTQQDPQQIAATLVEDGMTNPGFEAIVLRQEQSPLKADPYKVANPWITPEPGAGLIREQPALIAPANLYAYPGRGGTMLFALDEHGKRIPLEAGSAEVAAVSRGKRFRRAGSQAAGMGSSGGSGMSGMSGMSGGGMTAEQEAEEKKLYEAEKKRLEQKLVGAVDDAEKSKLEEEMTELEASQIPSKEVLKGLRWVVITATFDHKKMRENYLDALKNPAVADPYYKNVDVERQVRQSDGSWSEWTAVDRAENLKVLDNLPDEDEEITTEDVRIPELVNQLPFLKAGYWEKVHVASLVPRDRREIAPPSPAGRGGFMPGMGRSGMSGASGMSGSSGMDYMGGMSGMPGMGGMEGMGPGMGGSGSGMGGMGGMGGMDVAENLNFTKTAAETIMVRSLDFTVEQDTTYRFRLRVVVRNPNLGREDIAAGVDVSTAELLGPWSEPTDEVTMPADVTAYAVRKVPSASPGSEQILFQVTRWNPEDGFTTVRDFNAGPGQIIGDPRDAQVPATDGTGAKNKKIDFNSRQVVLDAMGGDQPIPPMPGMVGSRFEVPALSLVMRDDGSVVVRNQARDLHDEVRKDMEANYKRELEESGQNREMRAGQGMMGMGPGMGSGMGSGMAPPRRGGGRR